MTYVAALNIFQFYLNKICRTSDASISTYLNLDQNFR